MLLRSLPTVHMRLPESAMGGEPHPRSTCYRNMYFLPSALVLASSDLPARLCPSGEEGAPVPIAAKVLDELVFRDEE